MKTENGKKTKKKENQYKVLQTENARKGRNKEREEGTKEVGKDE